MALDLGQGSTRGKPEGNGEGNGNWKTGNDELNPFKMLFVKILL